MTVTTSQTFVWYGAGALWKSVISPTAIATSPDSVSAPWVTTCASITSSAAPSSTSIRPAQESGRTEKPKSAQTMQIAPNAPGMHDAGMEELEAEAGEPGEEEQADDVRIDQRREEARQEAGVHVDDLSRSPCAA